MKTEEITRYTEMIRAWTASPPYHLAAVGVPAALHRLLQDHQIWAFACLTPSAVDLLSHWLGDYYHPTCFIGFVPSPVALITVPRTDMRKERILQMLRSLGSEATADLFERTKELPVLFIGRSEEKAPGEQVLRVMEELRVFLGFQVVQGFVFDRREDAHVVDAD